MGPGHARGPDGVPVALGLRRLRPCPAATGRPRLAARARAAVWAVDAVARRVLPRRPCLTQALVGRRALRRFGVETALQIGAVRDEGGAFSAHAWLEHGGRVVLGANHRIGHYARFTTFADREARGGSAAGVASSPAESR